MPVLYTLRKASYPKYGYDLSDLERASYPDIIVCSGYAQAQQYRKLSRARLADFHIWHIFHGGKEWIKIDDGALVEEEFDNCAVCLKASHYRG